MAISNYSGIRSQLFEYSNNIWSPKSDRIEYQIPLFGTQLFEYSNNLNYSFKHWYRAVIDGVEGDTAVVTFTQYGNSAYCHVNNILDSNMVSDSDGQIVTEQENKNDNDENVVDEWN